MFIKNIEFMASIYDKLDALLITNRDGIVEYSARFDAQDNRIKNEGYTGKSILAIYPTLSVESSSHFRVMRTGRPIMDEKQTLTDLNGHTVTFLSSTYPIEHNNEIIGAIEGSVLLQVDGMPFKQVKSGCETLSEKRLFCLDDIITSNSAMKLIKEKVRKIAEKDSSVMIIGETGTGKELIAQSLHTHSKRNGQPFISQNCSAIPMNLLESLLFGTVKGSYTGAEDREGLFELADHGTLFLDELNSMDISLQGKILKAIEEKKFRRIGSNKEKNVDVRVVSAMNQEPHDLINRNELRSDLFYRLGVIQIHLPPLRNRKEDILLLMQHFIDQFNQASNGKIAGISNIVEKTLMNYDWPGNIRELRNTIEYAFNFISGTIITLNDIPETILYSSEQMIDESKDNSIPCHFDTPLATMMAKYEKEILIKALETGGSVTNAARLLGTSRQTLHYKIMKHHLILEKYI